MQKLDLNLVKKLELTELQSVEEVRRKNNSYAINAAGKLCAVSYSGQKEEALSLEVDAADLEHLYLAENPALASIEFVGDFPKLKLIYLNNCSLTRLKMPKACPALTQLYLQKNQLETFEFTGACPALTLIDLSENQLKSLVLPGGFTQLAYLFLQKNNLKELAFRVNPANLNTLDLRNNELAKLPDQFHQLNKLETLYLANNPSLNIPSTLIGTGENNNSAQSVLSYLRSIATTKRVLHLHEAKMILVGNPEVGKSSIRVKLQNRDALLPKEEERTPGLEVEPYYLKDLPTDLTHLDQPIDFQLNIWDFGGQGRYREIQQLFCSPKSLYLYVTSPDDKPEQKKENYVGLEYWLLMINAYSHDLVEERPSPVIYVLNKIDLDDWTEKKPNWEQFDNLIKFVKISALKGQNLDELAKVIKEALPEVSKDMFTDTFSEEWFRVKDHLEQIPEHYLSYEAYLAICIKEGLDEAQAKAWLSTLDRIGTVIYFGDKHALGDWIVLKPSWVKDAICKVIDNKSVQVDGILREEDYDAIWPLYPNPEERQNLLKIMEAFKLAFPISQRGRIVHMVPAALFNQPKPSFAEYPHLERNPDHQIKLQFEPFIPAGITNKVMVDLYKNIYNLLIWGEGCILHDPVSNTYAELKEAWDEKCVYINLFGYAPAAFFEKMLTVFDAVRQEFKLLKLSFSEQVLVDDLWLGKDYLLSKNKYPFLSDQFIHKNANQNNPMEEIKKLIGRSRIEEAIKAMEDIAPQYLKNDILQLREKHDYLKSQEIRGVLTFEQKSTSRAQLVDAILAMCDVLEKALAKGGDLDLEPHVPPGVVKNKIYFSYAWGDTEEDGESREAIVNELYESLSQEGFNVQRDKMNLEYGGLISEFMGQIGAGDLIVVFISDKYIRSPYCMFELYEIARNARWEKTSFASRVLPVAIDRIRFDDPDVLDTYFEYWKAEETKWANFIQKRIGQISAAQSNRYHQTKEIHQNFGDLSDWLTDMNAKTKTILSQHDFAEVKKAILARLAKV
jgi:GTPase SAR1 family protein